METNDTNQNNGLAPQGDPMAEISSFPSEPITALVANTTSLDVPPPLLAIMQMPTTPINQQGIGQIPTGVSAGMNPQAPVLDFRSQPSYAVGGQVGPGGTPIRPAGIQPQGGQAGGNMNPKMLDMQVQDFMNKNPEVVARIRAAIEAGLQSGELTQQELNMAIQLAQVVLQNPEMYPQIRRFAIQQGLADEQDLSPQYDQGLVMAILMAAKAMQADVQIQSAGGQGMQSAQMQQPMASMRSGGKLPENSANQYGSIPITAHEGEYVIPSHIVKAKGTEFFDSMLEKYKEKS